MLKVNGKTFMNIQEAVQWLLDNNALPFQSSANYIANTEIGLGTIINPSPAKVRIGSLIFFADSKVSTVIGLTENGFIVSDQYNDLVDDVVYVSNVALNAQGHLIVTLSNGQDIDAGLIKQVWYFSIDASQHLIVHYNDTSTTDLGAIFSGNLSISGNIDATGYVSSATARWSANMPFSLSADAISKGITRTMGYSKLIEIDGVLHFVFHMTLENTSAESQTLFYLGNGFQDLPERISSKIIDLDGNPLNITIGSEINITAGLLTVNSSKSSASSQMETINFALQHPASPANRLSLVIAQSAGFAIPAGAKRYVSGRLALTLIE